MFKMGLQNIMKLKIPQSTVIVAIYETENTEMPQNITVFHQTLKT